MDTSLHESGDLLKVNHFKARIELVGEADDINMLSDVLKATETNDQ